MTRDEIATKVADNAILRAVGRVALILAIPLISWFLAQQAIVAAKQTESLLALGNRVLVIESNQIAGRERGDVLRAAVKELGVQADFFSETQHRQNLQILTQLAVVIARLDAMEKRP